MLRRVHSSNVICLSDLSKTFRPALWVLSRNVGTKLFIGGLSFDINETILRDAFIQHGDVIEVRVICDHVSSKSKGYGFVRFASKTAAASALEEMNGQNTRTGKRKSIAKLSQGENLRTRTEENFHSSIK